MGVEILWSTPDVGYHIVKVLRRQNGTLACSDRFGAEDFNLLREAVSHPPYPELEMASACLHLPDFFYSKDYHPRILNSIYLAHRLQSIVTNEGGLIISDTFAGWKEMLNGLIRINIGLYKSSLVNEICSALHELCPVVFQPEYNRIFSVE